MKHVLKVALGASLFALAACGGKGDDSAAANVEANSDAAADNLDAMADNTSNQTVADELENRADATREAGEEKADAIDDADINAEANHQ